MRSRESILRFEAYCEKRQQIKDLQEFICKLDQKKAEALFMIEELENSKKNMFPRVNNSKSSLAFDDTQAIVPPSFSNLPKPQAVLFFEENKNYE